MTYLNKWTTVVLAVVVAFAAFNWFADEKNYNSHESIDVISIKDIILKSFSTANPSLLRDYLSQNVDLEIEDRHHLENGKMTIELLDTFFLANPPQKIYFRHRGNNESKNGSYYILDMKTKYQKQFRCYFYIEEELIVEISIYLDEDLTKNRVVGLFL